MRFWEFTQIVEYFQQFKKINIIHRIDYETLMVEFDRENFIYFNMRRSTSFIYKKEMATIRPNKITSPFDTLVSQRFQRTQIEKIEVINGDKILRISVRLSNKYRMETSSIQFEFTGKHTNIILLDENQNVVEALHHISEFQSVRPVKLGRELDNPPKPDFEFKKGEKLENLDKYLENKYLNFLTVQLNGIKNREVKKIDRKIEKLVKNLAKAENEQSLFRKSDKYKEIGELILINLYSISTYSKSIQLANFQGEIIEFERPNEAKDNSQMANMFFNSSKKFRRKAENSKVEQKSLNGKIEFLKKLKNAISDSQNFEELAILIDKPKENKKEKRESSQEFFETFWIEGHKVILGKSENGNIHILDKSKSGDIWIHLKDRPSSHTLIITDKREIKESIIREAGKLCVKFSVSEKGSYLVDYTKRRYVRIQSGSNVLYTNYKTIKIDI